MRQSIRAQSRAELITSRETISREKKIYKGNIYPSKTSPMTFLKLNLSQ
jgi:hypothetical protein